MGPALWVFLWLWREAGLKDGKWAGEVRGGRPIRLEEIAGDLGIPLRTVERHIALLRKGEYLETWRANHAIEAMVFLWDPEVEARAADEAANRQKWRLENDSPAAKNGGSLFDSGPAAKNDESQPPKMAVRNPPRPPHKEFNNSREPYFSIQGSHECVLNVPAAAERLTTNAPVERETTGAERGPAVAGGSQDTPGLALARKLLARVEVWERPELTQTLKNKLGRLDPGQVEQAFDFVWRRHRYRSKGLDSPAAWWASMLARAADELSRAGPG